MNPLRRIALLIVAMSLTAVTPVTAGAQEDKWAPEKAKESEFTGRKLDTFQHGVKKEWGYAEPQRDTFLVLHPKQARAGAPALRRPAFRRA